MRALLRVLRVRTRWFGEMSPYAEGWWNMLKQRQMEGVDTVGMNEDGANAVLLWHMRW